jgi:hypothetical protein
MAKARKATLVCRPCGTAVMVTDLGEAVVECYECGMELEPQKAGAPKKLAAVKKPAAKKAPAKKVAAKKPAAKKPAPKKKK